MIINFEKTNIEQLIKDYFANYNAEHKYFDDFGCFDIEVTSSVEFTYGINMMRDPAGMPLYGLKRPTYEGNIDNLAIPIMYIWQFQLGENTILGRTWAAYIEFMNMIKAAIDNRFKYIIYVHNLSYEASFLQWVLELPKESIVKKSAGTVLKVEDGCIEYRCSRELSNQKLEDFTAHIEHKKAVDVNYDYDKPRFPWTELTEDELKYCVNDVLGLREAIQELLKANNVTLQNAPLTSTGFIRRMLRDIMKDKNAPLVSYEAYKYLKPASRGGNTCPARKYRSAYHDDDNFGTTVIENVYSYDAGKYYPSILLHEKFPMSNFTYLEDASMEGLLKLSDNDYAWVAKLTFEDIELKDPNEPIPYIFKSKSSNKKGCKWYLGSRLEKAEYITITVTDVDFAIINEMYNFKNILVTDCWYSKYGKLPNYITDLVLQLYYDTIKYKKDTPEYRAAKVKLNSVHGLFGTNRLHEKYVIDDEGELILQEKSKKAYNRSIAVDKYSYAWYVWGTAIARYRLQQLINANKDNVVYVAVDSIKTVGPANLTEHNKRIKKLNSSWTTESGQMINIKGGIGEFILEWKAPEFIAFTTNMYVRTTEKPIELNEYWTNWANELAETLRDPKPLSEFNIEVSMSGIDKMQASLEIYLRGGLKYLKKGYYLRNCQRTASKQVGGKYKVKTDLKPANSTKYLLSKEDLKMIKKGVEISGGMVIINKKGVYLGDHISEDTWDDWDELADAVEMLYRDYKIGGR